MEITTYRIKRTGKSETDFYTIIPIGDSHIGSAGFDEKRLRETVEIIRTHDNYYWIGMGDLIEAINLNDKRFDPRSIDSSYNIKNLDNLITTQIEDCKNIFRPIKDKCLCMLTGNHEETIRLRYYRAVTMEICNEFKVKYMGYDGLLRIIFDQSKDKTIGNKTSFDFYLHHGYGGGRTPGAKTNILEKQCRMWNVDVVVMAHLHAKVCTPPLITLSLNHQSTKILSRKCYGVMTGCYRKSHVLGGISYEERMGYGANDLGSPRIKLYPRNRLEKAVRIEIQ